MTESSAPASPSDEGSSVDEPAVSEAVLLATPADGVPDPITTAAELAAAVARFAAGTGPVAVDAERASGYRYSQRAYLVQLRRQGAGTLLIDPIALPDLSSLNDVIGPLEWVLHAANQDLPCLAEVGLAPARLFDTELAGRLLGDDRVALGTMVDKHLGIRLEKGHSAADWSTRPLPRDWLVYAALDVELLVALRDTLEQLLQKAGKLDWAHEEFEAVRVAGPAAPRPDRWRRTSGIHAIRQRRGLAAVRALWEARDDYARERDVAPGRILADSAIVAAVRANAQDATALSTISGFNGPRQRRNLNRWAAALAEAAALPTEDLPPIGAAGDAVPPTSRWRDRVPDAAERLVRCREVINALAEQLDVLAQNLLASDVIRRLAWAAPAATLVDGAEVVSAHEVRETLARFGARPWQIDVTAEPLAVALTEAHHAILNAAAAAEATAEPATGPAD